MSNSFAFINADNELQQLDTLQITTDNTTITNNLNVLQNINCIENINVNNNIIIKKGLKVPVISTPVLNENGSIYYNNTSNLFMGYTNNGWNNLGGGGLTNLIQYVANPNQLVGLTNASFAISSNKLWIKTNDSSPSWSSINLTQTTITRISAKGKIDNTGTESDFNNSSSSLNISLPRNSTFNITIIVDDDYVPSINYPNDTTAISTTNKIVTSSNNQHTFKATINNLSNSHIASSPYNISIEDYNTDTILNYPINFNLSVPIHTTLTSANGKINNTDNVLDFKNNPLDVVLLAQNDTFNITIVVDDDDVPSITYPSNTSAISTTNKNNYRSNNQHTFTATINNLLSSIDTYDYNISIHDSNTSTILNLPTIKFFLNGLPTGFDQPVEVGGYYAIFSVGEFMYITAEGSNFSYYIYSPQWWVRDSNGNRIPEGGPYQLTKFAGGSVVPYNQSTYHSGFTGNGEEGPTGTDPYRQFYLGRYGYTATINRITPSMNNDDVAIFEYTTHDGHTGLFHTTLDSNGVRITHTDRQLMVSGDSIHFRSTNNPYEYYLEENNQGGRQAVINNEKRFSFTQERTDIWGGVLKFNESSIARFKFYKVA